MTSRVRTAGLVVLLVGLTQLSVACATPPDVCKFSTDQPHMGTSAGGLGKVNGKVTIQNCTAPTNLATDVHIDGSLDNANWKLVGSQVQGWRQDNATYLQGVATTGGCYPGYYRTWGRAFAYGVWTNWDSNTVYLSCA